MRLIPSRFGSGANDSISASPGAVPSGCFAVWPGTGLTPIQCSVPLSAELRSLQRQSNQTKRPPHVGSKLGGTDRVGGDIVSGAASASHRLSALGECFANQSAPVALRTVGVARRAWSLLCSWQACHSGDASA